MERVLDVYKKPFNEMNPVVCMDESPKQLISSTKSVVPMKKGKDQRIDYEYTRHGMVNIFMANEPLMGRRLVEVTQRKTKEDWARFVKRIADELYPDAKKITLVMDNFSTHTASAFYETFAPEEAKRIWDRFEFVYTPKHGSWLNIAECEFSVLQRQCLDRRIDSAEFLAREVNAWQDERNTIDSKVNWQFTTDGARTKLRRLYPEYLRLDNGQCSPAPTKVHNQ